MAASGSVAIQGVPSPMIGGVQLTRTHLHYEAQRSLGIARRVGRRLMRWLKQTDGHEEEISRVVGRDPETGRELRDPIVDKDGVVMVGPILPDQEFRDAWTQYERTVRNLLNEQRLRAQMVEKSNAPQISDEQYEAQIAELARRAVLEMPRAELESLLAARRMNIVQGATGSRESPNQDEPASHRTDEVQPDRSEHPTASASAGADGGESPDLLDFGDGDE